MLNILLDQPQAVQVEIKQKTENKNTEQKNQYCYCECLLFGARIWNVYLVPFSYEWLTFFAKEQQF